MNNILGDRKKGNLEEVLAYTKKLSEEPDVPEAPSEPKEPVKPLNKVSSASNEPDYFLLKDISCVDADGAEFEKHDRIYVNKNIEKNADGSQISKKPYNWIVYFEQNGIALPSFALSCNILSALWQNRNSADCMNVLMQYKDKGNDYGWHCQNTLVDWGSAQVIHYPSDSDFTSNGGNSNINAGRRIALPFSKDGLKSMPLEQALNDAVASRFVKQLTCMEHPEVLVEIGKYFDKPAYVWTLSGDETRAAWLGCDSNNFILIAYENLYGSNAARGVRSS